MRGSAPTVECRWNTHTPEETVALGRVVGSALEAGDLFLLRGNLGLGKTTFVKGVGLGLGVSGEVKSPTFALHLMYEGRHTLHHVDLYRLERPQEVRELGLDEIFGRDGVCLVEWPERLESVPSFAVAVEILEGSQSTDRVFIFRGPSEVMDRVQRAAGQAGIGKGASQ